MSMLETPRATWEKRFFAGHYSYRDSAQVASLVLSEAQALGLIQLALAGGLTVNAGYYVYGTNARTTISPLTGVAYGAVAYPTNCYARRVSAVCTQNAWIKNVSLNPTYLREAMQYALGIPVIPSAPQLIFEREQYVPATTLVTFFPTYGYAMGFRADTVQGILTVNIESNVEGGE